MKDYYISTNARMDGSYTVHCRRCPLIDYDTNMISLGKFETVGEALEKGRDYFFNVRECPFCLGVKKKGIEGNGLPMAGYCPDNAVHHISAECQDAYICCTN
jgi:hypothetical protein